MSQMQIMIDHDQKQQSEPVCSKHSRFAPILPRLDLVYSWLLNRAGCRCTKGLQEKDRKRKILSSIVLSLHAYFVI